MGVYLVGQVIKRTRESLGMTQEELSDGICSVETLSRIENGKRAPNRANFEALMERMGKCGKKYIPYVHHRNMEVHRMLEKLRACILRRNYEEAENILDEMERCLNLEDPVNRQLILLFQATVKRNLKQISVWEYMHLLEESLSCTLPCYEDHGILPRGVLTRAETQILIGIAVAYILEDDLDMAILMLEQLWEYYENIKIDTEERILAESSILNNLARCYGRKGQFDRSSEISLLNMNQCIRQRIMTNLPSTIYGAAYSMEHMDEDPKACKELFIQAYYAAEQSNNRYLMNHIKEHMVGVYGEDVVRCMVGVQSAEKSVINT